MDRTNAASSVANRDRCSAGSVVNIVAKLGLVSNTLR